MISHHELILFQEIVNYETQIRKTTEDTQRLRAVQKTIDDHHNFLTGQYETYKQYLANVRENTTGPVKGGKDKKGSKETKKMSVVKFSHIKLQQDGVIIESEVPEERWFSRQNFPWIFTKKSRRFLRIFAEKYRRNNIFFQFQSSGQGNFTVTVLYKSRAISEMSMQLDDLLEKQHHNQLELETEFLKLNVNLLIFLINKHFNS